MADLIGRATFVDLEPLVQERLFAPCCLSSEQLWAQGFEWSGSEIDDTVVKPTLKRLGEVRNESVESMQDRLGYDGPRDLLNNTLLEGDEYAVEFLAWYLQETLDGVHCKVESNNNDSEPDISISHHEVHSCNVEVKRIVSATNMRAYAKGFADKEWQRYDPRHPSILLFVFPLLSVDAWRAELLTTGYHGFCKELDEWHDDSMHTRIVAAPLDVEEDTKELPLRRAVSIVDEFVP
ncbi:hypothetical protein RYH80_12895 [Halobaculum sp. MBLA0147]|uniref:hypothetical protein n=1 Tax=Halobaculum sp. MBLA0147 TaxID=3079934 RepID=UPI0035259153